MIEDVELVQKVGSFAKHYKLKDKDVLSIIEWETGGRMFVENENELMPTLIKASAQIGKHPSEIMKLLKRLGKGKAPLCQFHVEEWDYMSSLDLDIPLGTKALMSFAYGVQNAKARRLMLDQNLVFPMDWIPRLKKFVHSLDMQLIVLCKVLSELHVQPRRDLIFAYAAYRSGISPSSIVMNELPESVAIRRLLQQYMVPAAEAEE